MGKRSQPGGGTATVSQGRKRKKKLGKGRKLGWCSGISVWVKDGWEKLIYHQWPPPREQADQRDFISSKQNRMQVFSYKIREWIT